MFASVITLGMDILGYLIFEFLPFNTQDTSLVSPLGVGVELALN